MMNHLPHDGSDDRRGEVVIKLIAFCFGAGVGALVGAFFIFPFVDAFLGPLPHLRLYCSLGIGLLSGWSSYSKAARQAKRQRRTSEVAGQLGLDYSSDDEEQLTESIRAVFSDADFVSLSNVMRKPVGSAQVVIADLLRRRRSSNESSSDSSTTRTIACFDSPELNWPAFTLQPEGMALTMLSRLMGIEDIDFEDYPEFSKAYHLTGARPDLVRQVFTPELLQYFTERPDLEVRADGGRLVLVRPGRPCEPEQVEAFLQTATEAFTTLVKASVQTQAARDATAAQSPPEQALENMPGLVGAMIRRAMVTPEDLHAFLCSQPPRQVPPKIRARRYSGGSLMAALIGIFFIAGGSVFAAVSLLDTGAPWDEDRIGPLAFGILFPLVGGLVAFFSLRYRWRNWRLLKHGIVVDAEVISVEATGVQVNNEQQYRMSLRFNTRMGTQETQCNIYGRKARELKRLAETNETTRILYDPRNPRRVLWAESLMLDYQF